MNRGVMFMLDLAQGPIFRCAFALLVLGLLRLFALRASDIAAGYLTSPDRAAFRRKLRLHVLWHVAPTVILHRARPGARAARRGYDLAVCWVSVIFRIGVLVVPAFMVAHVYLWERNLGISWPALPPSLADTLSVVTITAGVLFFLGRLYSPTLRAVEPTWSFLKPLILVLPFATGVLAMHPAWSPVDYHVVLLLHVLSAAVVFALIPFARLLSTLHVPLTRVMPEAEWCVSPLTAAPHAGGLVAK